MTLQTSRRSFYHLQGRLLQHRPQGDQAGQCNGEKPLGNLWAGCEKNTGKFQSFSNHHNIYYFEDTRDFSLYKQYDLYDEQTVFGENLYYSQDPQDEFKGMFPPDSLTFAELPEAGSYGNVWKNPEFADVTAHNYQLSDSSPAWSVVLSLK